MERTAPQLYQLHGRRRPLPRAFPERPQDSIRAVIQLQHVSLSQAGPVGDPHVYFAQMQGTLELSGVIGGSQVTARGPGFFETYLR